MSHVFVVDDQNYLRSVLAMVLRIKGLEVVVAESGGAGLQELEDSNFELVVIDIFLQDGMGDIELIRMLQDDPSLPITAISGVALTDLLTQYPELSNVIRLSKPFRPTELNACGLTRLLSQTCDEGTHNSLVVIIMTMSKV
jgi:two-component system, NtrC family, response regulator PilR